MQAAPDASTCRPVDQAGREPQEQQEDTGRWGFLASCWSDSAKDPVESVQASSDSDAAHAAATVQNGSEDSSSSTESANNKHKAPSTKAAKKVTTKEQPSKPAAEDDIPRSATNLYVGGLAPSVRDEELERRFGAFGTVVSAKVMLNIHSGESRGMGFVKFADAESASAAVRGMHKAHLAGQRLVVRHADSRADYRPAEKSNRVYVRNVPFEVTAGALQEQLKQYGEVSECTLHLDTAGFKAGGQGVRSRMAFVTMATVEGAEAAVRGLHMARPFGGESALMAKIAESQSSRAQHHHQKLVRIQKEREERRQQPKPSKDATVSRPAAAEPVPASGPSPTAVVSNGGIPPAAPVPAAGPVPYYLPTAVAGGAFGWPAPPPTAAPGVAPWPFPPTVVSAPHHAPVVPWPAHPLANLYNPSAVPPPAAWAGQQPIQPPLSTFTKNDGAV